MSICFSIQPFQVFLERKIKADTADPSHSYRRLAEIVHRALVSAGHSHEAVKGPALTVESRAVGFNLSPAVQHNLRTQREILHQHASVVQHLTLTVSGHRTTWANGAGREYNNEQTNNSLNRGKVIEQKVSVATLYDKMLLATIS